MTRLRTLAKGINDFGESGYHGLALLKRHEAQHYHLGLAAHNVEAILRAPRPASEPTAGFAAAIVPRWARTIAHPIRADEGSISSFDAGDA